MTFRTASTTFNTSGYRLFQSAYVDDSGKITSFNTGDTRVDKYIRNDYLGVGYKKVLSPHLLLEKSGVNNKVWYSTDALNWTEETTTGMNTPYSNTSQGCYWNGYWYRASDSFTPVIERSSDRISWGSSLGSATNYTYFYPDDPAVLFAFQEGNLLKRSTDGTTFNTIASLANASSVTKLSSSFIASKWSNDLIYVSNDNGATFTGYTTDRTNVGRIIFVCKLTVSGQDRCYVVYQSDNGFGTYYINIGYFTNVPTANGHAVTDVATIYSGSTAPTMWTSFAYSSSKCLLTLPYPDSGQPTVYSLTSGSSQYIESGGITYSDNLFYDKVNDKFYITFGGDQLHSQAASSVDVGNSFTNETSNYTGITMDAVCSISWKR